MPRLRLLFTLLCAVLASACGRESPPAAASSIKWQALFPDSTGWMTWVGYGISFQTPPGATIIPDTSRFTGLSGAQIGAFVGGGDVPDFRVFVAVVLTHNSTPLAIWVDSMRANRNKVLDQELARLSPPRRRTVGALQGLELLPFCGDCEVHELYVQADSFRVTFEYSLESGSLLTRRQQDSLYARMVRSVQLR